jgi:transposase
LHYKGLQDTERCFRTLKSSLDIKPVYHFVDRRMRAHVSICVMAFRIQRLMRQRLHLANIHTALERMLETLSLERSMEVKTESGHTQGLLTSTPSSSAFSRSLGVGAPQHNELGDSHCRDDQKP